MCFAHASPSRKFSITDYINIPVSSLSFYMLSMYVIYRTINSKCIQFCLLVVAKVRQAREVDRRATS